MQRSSVQWRLFFGVIRAHNSSPHRDGPIRYIYAGESTILQLAYCGQHRIDANRSKCVEGSSILLIVLCR